MSLIEEALRRAQTTQPKPEAVSQEALSSAPELPPRASPVPSQTWRAPVQESWFVNVKWWLSLAVGGTTLVVLTLWGYSIILRWQFSQMAATPPEPPRALVPSTAEVSVPVPPTPIQPAVAKAPTIPKPSVSPPARTALARRKRPEFTLHGIVEGRGEPVAIINGMILRTGENVAGATLLEIDGDKAKLRWRDEELVLSTTQ